MILRKQWLDYNEPWQLPDVYLFTGNSYVSSRGRLVMGRGAARAVRDRWLHIDKRLAQVVQQSPDRNVLFTHIGNDPAIDKQFIGWFKVKHYFRDAAEIAIINKSTKELTRIAKQNSHLRFHINYPGVGAGRLSVNEVDSIIQQLPDNVIVYL